MRKGETKGDKKLRYAVRTRLSKEKYQELTALLNKTKDETLAGLVRNILLNRSIKVYTHDETIDLLLEELASLRSELKAIGVNFNQITRYFNTYPEDAQKRFYAKIGFEKYQQTESKIERLLELMSNLCKKWLSG
jgi:Bacterial mobilisation protein (MobC).